MNKEETKSCIITGLIVFIITTIVFVLIVHTKEISKDEVPNDEKEIGNWTSEDGIVTIACYNLDGTGPTSKCKSKIKCFTKENTNGNKYETRCPMFIPNSNK